MKKSLFFTTLLIGGLLLTGCNNSNSGKFNNVQDSWDINEFDGDIIYGGDMWGVPIKSDKVMYYNTGYGISFIIGEDLSGGLVKEYDGEEYNENMDITTNNHFIIFSVNNGMFDSMKFFICAIPNEDYIVLIKDANREYEWSNTIIGHNNKYTFIMVADKLYFSDLQIYELPTESNSSYSGKTMYKQNAGNHISSTECYDYNGFLINNPEKDKEGNIVNCYNNKGWRNGKQIGYYEDGVVSYETNYKNGIRDGKQNWCYENGQVQYENNYKDGKLDGKQNGYYENGQVQYENNYKDGKLDGKQIGYYENGSISTILNYKNGEKDGKQTGYHEDGSISYETNYKNGKEDGKQIEYYDNGQLRYEENYKNGKEDGKQVHYYENGQVEYEHNYIDGIIEDGEVITYDSDGTIIFRGTYKNGERID